MRVKVEIKSVRDLIAEKIAYLTVRPSSDIHDDAEIYKDLKISGDDLLDLIEFCRKSFGTSFDKFVVSDYAPSEGGMTVPLLRTIFGREYRSFTFSNLIAAVQKGSW